MFSRPMFLLINVIPFYYRPLLSSSWLPLFFICFIFFCILSFFWQMLEAVDTIHEERIVHTDLKPANFLFVNGILKLIDFGIAKAISDDTTNIHRENQVGTLNYISPEALIDTSNSGGGKSFGKKNMDMKIGRSSDIWSMGCILYQMIYGRTPFADLGLVHKLRAIVSDEVQISYPQVPKKYQAALEVVKLCLQRDPKLRPSITGENGLLQHHFLHPGRRTAVVSQKTGLSSNECLTLIDSMRQCFAADNTHSEENTDNFQKLFCVILSAGQEMQRQQMDSHALRAAMAESIVAQLQQSLKDPENSEKSSINFNLSVAVQHAKHVQKLASRLPKASRPARKDDFVGQLKKKKSVLNKASVQSKKTSYKSEDNSLQAALKQGMASRFAKAGLQDDQTMQENWTVSDEF